MTSKPNEQTSESAADAERHATNLELFLDLVFVFAITQIASLVSHDVTWAGVGRGVLISFLVWWQWSQYTWAGAAADLQQRASTRVLVLATVPATLTMAAAIPEAYGDRGAWFGIAYLLVQLLVLGMFGALSIRTEATRIAFVRYASISVVMPIVVGLGGLVHGHARVAVWCVAALLNVVSALRGASAGEWTINAVHFAERHALFVIISLGEALVAIGASASERGLSARVLGGLVSAAFFACVLWWMYFAYLPNVVEHQLRALDAAHRGKAARDLFTFGHFPLIAGIVAYAVVVKHMVPEPTAALARADRSLLAAAVVVIVGGYLHLQWRVIGRLARERLVAVPLVVVLCAAATRLAGAWLIAAVALILLVMQMITWRGFRRGTLNSLLQHQ